MKKNLLAILVLTLLALPAAAMATPPRPGPYVAGFVGVTVPETVDATSFGGGTVFNDRIKFDPGLNVGGALGFDFGMMRLEGEISYKDLQLNAVTDRDTGERFRVADGSVDTTAFMANAFIDLHNDSPITPYLGGGIGFAALHLNDVFSRAGDFLYEADDQVVFAYQAGGGLEVALNRQLSLDLAYRYFGTSKASFINTEFEVQSHNATMGLRFKF
ncbi:outer membrane beta-barrel protein [Geomonas sp. Red69]|uniref:Outer membrane beta-barrel protein n=1 Tax=Geomonas diazotrophica TaxID=2843197 RepID=A0ABX8JKM4_9BACT|nr:MULTISPECIES: outer membrane beta-barrel protein [Geomonas]MBU5637037.1 outer membrane beta-barrel protein [Geomonas diazotrophica]QWV98933.1 outer membrane beta-barrel protein [Geomonas nitrogeniifigens]QXE88081.1 outer membrane beta-barrel protein [Geomonas nitrogeniifigens]